MITLSIARRLFLSAAVGFSLQTTALFAGGYERPKYSCNPANYQCGAYKPKVEIAPYTPPYAEYEQGYNQAEKPSYAKPYRVKKKVKVPYRGYDY